MDRRRRSFQVEIATIESHHLVNARDAELMKGCAVVQPNIDRRLSAFLCDQHEHQIRSLALREQRQVIDRLHVDSVPIASHTEITYRKYIVDTRSNTVIDIF